MEVRNMYDKKVLGIDECLKTVVAMVTENKRQGGLPIAIAIVDEHGDLICYAKGDSVPKAPGEVQGYVDSGGYMAIKKAYTAAHFRGDAKKLSEMMTKMNRNIAVDFDARYVALSQGGATAIVKPGEKTVYGAIGVGGRVPGEGDEEMAQYGLKVMQDILWPSK
jgi:uncharacterized protein GlcG (DUF336 family)